MASNLSGSSPNFLQSGGEMGALKPSRDWSATPFGHPETWPQSLKTTVRLLLTTQHPMFICWGDDVIQFYNDAYRQIMGPERHPSALGQRARECWDEIWASSARRSSSSWQAKGRPGMNNNSSLSPGMAGSKRSGGPTGKVGQTRYYFHLTSSTERILDDAGIEVDGPEQAYSEAIAAIQEMRAEAGERIEWDRWKLEITDPTGTVIFTLSLSDSVH